MTFGIEQILFAVVAIIAAYLGFATGRKVERPKAIQEGKEQATREIQTQAMEQSLERTVQAVEARNSVERMSDDQLSDYARKDSNNRLKGVRRDPAA